MKTICYIYVVVTIVFLTGCEKEKIQTKEKALEEKPKELSVNQKIENIQNELNQINTATYLEKYIIRVINEGSNANLGFAAGAMEKGYAYKSDAPDISRYVVTLSGKKSSDDVSGKKAAMFYSSNCGGCHGHEGKGLNGAFPDLTLKTYQGLKNKENYLKIKLETLKNSLK